ncbi:EVE domain-containing protein [Methanoculleus sp. FWC-SCC1]|uniref:EVE domain-containing protein n=1 Tax=Methanoculleus frigidifontis TaxID=2584085 RepID=A0ABT8MAB7_9EURY|nr:EVE domain-containing protein [Methanoculleus sp. FWC-SCC1]MDN7024872.1 EVE domain-containing protein [Methanoculleus sp. FWC-SCC1]
MTRWLGFSSGQNARIILQKNVWGVPMRFFNWIVRTEIGDTLLIYVDQQGAGRAASPPTVAACFEIVSDVYRDTARIFPGPVNFGDGVLPYRVALRPIAVFDPPISLEPLIPKLSFVADKQQWSDYIRGQAMRAIPEDDFRMIMDAQRRAMPVPPMA